jgi:hypothetical protein
VHICPFVQGVRVIYIAVIEEKVLECDCIPSQFYYITLMMMMILMMMMMSNSDDDDDDVT